MKKIIEEKVKIALKNKLTVILCIGENKIERENNKTMIVLKSQISNSVLKKKLSPKKLIIAYEPIWSIGSGKLPSDKELKKY